jgi:TetR/AcrR family transcriptional regulator, regulator of autoinduction and epiphytic fitness
MRTTKPQQAKTQRLLIRTAVDLMTQQGFEGTTMKQIARDAGVGDATIYNYFPTKERLVLGYFEQAFGDALAATHATPDWTDFNLQEQLQLLIDSVLQVMRADREFVAIAKAQVERTPMLMLSGEVPGKVLLQTAFAQMLSDAEAAGEILPCGFKPSLSALLADYVYALIAYWLRDTSEAFGNTTQLVDLSLGVLVLALKSGMVDKLLALGGFVIRSQLARMMQKGTGLIDFLNLARWGLGAQADTPAKPASPKHASPEPASSKRKKRSTKS